MGFFSGILDTVKSVVGGVKDVLSPVTDIFTGGLGDVLGAGLLYFGGQSANSANRDIAQQQMAFQADQSGTAYQRAVADMQKAGLNPMLAYSQGGASTPSGSSATMQNALGAGVSTAMQGRALRSTIENQESSSALNWSLQSKAQADAMLSTASAKNAAIQGQLLQSNLPKAANEAAAQRSWWMKNVSPYLPDLLKSTATASGAYSSVTR